MVIRSYAMCLRYAPTPAQRVRNVPGSLLRQLLPQLLDLAGDPVDYRSGRGISSRPQVAENPAPYQCGRRDVEPVGVGAQFGELVGLSRIDSTFARVRPGLAALSDKGSSRVAAEAAGWVVEEIHRGHRWGPRPLP